MSVLPIWWRQFVRSGEFDKDTIADTDFRTQNFTDYFGQFLQQGTNADLQTFDSILTVFWHLSKQSPPTCKIQIFMVADGAFIPQSRVSEDWFSPHVRLLAVVTPQPRAKATMFIVGSSNVKAKPPNTFLQVASWDGRTFRFFGVDIINGNNNEVGWVYQGNSFNAFDENPQDPHSAAYLGPFNGHVNGATIMKELHTPWYHWLSGENSNFLECISTKNQEFLEKIPYLTAPGQDCFMGAAVQQADQLEPIVKFHINNWYKVRLAADWSSPSSQQKQPKPQPTNVHRWMAHLLLTTTVNFSTSLNDGTTYTAPPDHFYNNELFLQSSSFSSEMLVCLVSVDATPGLIKQQPDLSQFTFAFDINQYNKVCEKLNISLLQELGPKQKAPSGYTPVELSAGTLGGGKQTGQYDTVNFVNVLPNKEGVPFVALQTAYEDAQGVLYMQTLAQLGSSFPKQLLSNKAVKALLMLDFWNPVYSWRRGVLMQYLPKVTTLISGPQYDLEKNFVAAVQGSNFAQQDQTSPEYQFLQLYEKGTDADYQTRITKYLGIVCTRLQKLDGLEDYMKLAESRRRIFRPLPLYEFGIQLPYALAIQTSDPLLEMTEYGTVQPIPARGTKFINDWTGSLHGYDPVILPFEASPTASLAAPQAAPADNDLADFAKLPMANSSRCPIAASPKARLRMGRAV